LTGMVTRQAGRQTDRQAGRQAGRQASRQIGKYTGGGLTLRGLFGTCGQFDREDH
jgi:hypothetical protein